LDRSANSDERCWGPPNNLDCNHDPNAFVGLAFGNGAIVEVLGWGKPGTIQKSTNGATWGSTLNHNGLGKISFGNNIFFTSGGWNSAISQDNGQTWKSIGNDIAMPVRQGAFIPYDNGRFLIVGEGGGNGAINYITADHIIGDSPENKWKSPTTFPSECISPASKGIAYGNNTIVLGGENNIICYSKDGGDHFISKNLGVTIKSKPIWVTNKFWAFTANSALTSADAITWETTPINLPSGTNLEVIQFGGGHFVGVHQSWPSYYEQQKFLHSFNGIDWSNLAPDKFKGSHPIIAIEFGHSGTSACP
jgi:hypothetical protein